MPKGKPKRKPQGQSTAASASQKTVSSSPHRSPEKANGLIPDSSPRWRGTLYDHWIEFVAGGLVILFVSLWVTEYREHEGTKAQLERTETDRYQVTGERDQARKELKDTRQENAELRKLHPILEFYGPRAKFTANYDLQKETGSKISLGRCPGEPCIELVLQEITKGDDGVQLARLGIRGRWGGIEARGRTLTIGPPLRRGCKSMFEAGQYQVTFAIEEDRVHDIRAGIGVSIGGDFQEGLSIGEQGCPPE